MGFEWIGANSFLGDGTSPITGSIAESVHGMVNDQMDMMSSAANGLPSAHMPQPPRPNRWDPHPDHFRQPRIGGGGRSRGPGGGMGVPQPNPGAPPPGMDDDTVNQALGQYGQRLPTPDEINPNAFLPNTGFFGRHQKFAAGLEGVLLGMANTAPSDTVGEGISNAIKGGLSPLAMRRQSVADQYDRPFQMASKVASIQKDHDEHMLKTAQSNYYNDRGQADVDKINASRPYTDANGNTQVFDKGSQSWKQQDSPDQELYKQFRDEQMHNWLRDPKNEGKSWGAEQEVQARGEFMKQMNTGLVKQGMQDSSREKVATIKKGKGGAGSSKQQLAWKEKQLAAEEADAEKDLDAIRYNDPLILSGMRTRYKVASQADLIAAVQKRADAARKAHSDFISDPAVNGPMPGAAGRAGFHAGKSLDINSLVSALIGDK